MSKNQTIANQKPKDSRYYILEAAAGGYRKRRRVEAQGIAYDVIGVRLNDDKQYVLDHIVTGLEIVRFRNEGVAYDALLALMQISNFKFNTPPRAIRAEVAAAIKRFQQEDRSHVENN